MSEPQAAAKRSIAQFIWFAAIGVVNTLVDLGAYWIIVQLSISYVIANIAAYGIGMLNSYLWNNAVTFRSKGKVQHDRATIIRFIVWNLCTLAISSLLIIIAVEWLSLTTLVSKLIVIPCVIVFQFVGTKKWVFRK